MLSSQKRNPLLTLADNVEEEPVSAKSSILTMESAHQTPMLECNDSPPLASVSCQQEECTPLSPFTTVASPTGSEKSTPTTSHVCVHVGDLCDEHAFRSVNVVCFRMKISSQARYDSSLSVVAFLSNAPLSINDLWLQLQHGIWNRPMTHVAGN
jgi:hypothetical protein